jgi:hypothetical protein
MDFLSKKSSKSVKGMIPVPAAKMAHVPENVEGISSPIP